MKKLGARGIAHLMAMVLVIVVVAIGGVAYMVASHAGSVCRPGGPVSKVRSGYIYSCGPVQVACSIVGVDSLPYGKKLRPKLLLNNASIYRTNVTFYTAIRTFGAPGQSGKLVSETKHVKKMKAGQQLTVKLKSYKVKYATPSVKYVQYQVAQYPGGPPMCSGVSQLPNKPPKP